MQRVMARGGDVATATVAAFVDDMALVRAPATVRRYIASIATAHKALGRGRTLRSAAVRLALQRMHRRKGRRQAQAHGLTWPLRQRLLEASGERLIDARNRALLAVAYGAVLRRSELTALQVDDIVEEIHGAATLLAHGGKTDPEGRGAMVYLARDTVALVREWRSRSGIDGGRLFRSLSKGGALGAAFDASQIPPIYKGMAPGRAAAGSGGRAVGTQRAGGSRPGHRRERHRAARDPAGRALEDHGDVEPLPGAAAGASERSGAARPAVAPRIAGRLLGDPVLGAERRIAAGDPTHESEDQNYVIVSQRSVPGRCGAIAVTRVTQ